jgi:hypothetical protein
MIGNTPSLDDGKESRVRGQELMMEIITQSSSKE